VAHPLNESAKSAAHNSERMVGNARAAFVIPVAEVFISSFNDTRAHKQSQIKINFAKRRWAHRRTEPCADALSKRVSQINTSRRKRYCRSSADRKRRYSGRRSAL
jgi:hypothetical protein